jgi:hypothetical protein
MEGLKKSGQHERACGAKAVCALFIFCEEGCQKCPAGPGEARAEHECAHNGLCRLTFPTDLTNR